MSATEEAQLLALEAALAAVPVAPHVPVAEVRKSLASSGVALICTGTVDFDAVRRCVGDMLVDTFPTIPDDVATELHDGHLGGFRRFWKNKKIGEHEIMLLSCGMPQVLPLHRSIVGAHTDDVTGRVYTKNPLAAGLALSVHQFLPTGLIPANSYVSDDGCKVIAGAKATPLHHDGDHAVNAGDIDENTRVQIILVDDVFAKRHLSFVADTPAIRAALAAATGTSTARERGFKTLDLQRYPRVISILRKHAVKIARGVAMFRSGVIHFEEQVVNHEVDDTFRVYMGYIPNANMTTSRRLRMRMAFLRGHGYTPAPFQKLVNRKCALFVNDKSTQWHQSKQMQADSNLVALMATPQNVMEDWVLRNVPECALSLQALSGNSTVTY